MVKHALIAAAAIVMLAGPSLAQPRGAAALDANGDGKVTLSEFQAGRGGQMMARLDANKDGKLSKAELSKHKLGPHFGMLDADKNGTLSPTEFAAGKAM